MNRHTAAQNIYDLLESIDNRCQAHDEVSTTVEAMTDVEKAQMAEFVSLAFPPPEVIKSHDGRGYRMLYLWCKQTLGIILGTELLELKLHQAKHVPVTNPTDMLDFLAPVEHVEIKVNHDGRIWININGACALRVNSGKHSITLDANPDQFKNG